QWTSGFGFSAGFVDYTLSLVNPMANKPLMLIVQGLFFFVLYYIVFRFLITKFNLKTPGREDDEEIAEEHDEAPEAGGGENAIKAAKIYEGLGGDENVTSVDYCTARLLVEVNDMDKVDEAKIRSTGVPGVHLGGKDSIQVNVGASVELNVDESEKIRKDVEIKDEQQSLAVRFLLNGNKPG